MFLLTLFIEIVEKEVSVWDGGIHAILSPKEPYIAIVGVCAAGKSTLAEGLTQMGIKAIAVPQEHSVVRRLWAKLHPTANLLVVLDACYETTKARRPTISYGPERLAEQRRRLAQALAECDLFIPTDELGIEAVREKVVRWVEDWKERSE